MKKTISYIFALCLFLTYGDLFSQVKKAEKPPDIAGLSFVKSNKILLRWATGKQDLWKAGNQNGYKIERILFDDFKNSNDVNTKSVTLNSSPIKPWSQNDEKWTNLLKKNKNAALLYNLLYKAEPNASSIKKEMIFSMVLKSCDLYADIATAAGIFFSDSTFNANETYVYKIFLWTATKTGNYTPCIINVNAKEKTKLASLKPIKAKFQNKKAVITLVTAGTEDYYSGFWIERSTDSINFSTVNKAALIQSTTSADVNKTESTYNDSLPENGKKYYYRVRGISYFGELSEPSIIVSGKGKPDFTEYPIIDSTLIIKNKTVLLKFSMPDKYNLNELKGYEIFRSETKKGKFTSISNGFISNKTKEFRDEKPLPNNYYKICAYNLTDDSSFSFTTNARLIDDVPPAIPSGLTGKIDTSGNVSLSWETNKEADLLGYRVFRCNSEKEQPVEITKVILKEPKFTDKISLNTLTKEVYYTLRSVDKIHNNSDYSPLLKLNRPDKIAPVAPLFKQTIYTDSSIQLIWHLSSSNDVATYKLLKSDKAEDNWQVIKEWAGKDSLKNYSDTSISIGKRYKYRLEVYDESKNYSLVNSPSILFQPAFAPKIKTLKGVIDLKQRSITLSWANTMNDVYNYTLYKSKGDEPLRVFETLEAKTDVYNDTELYPNNKYRYAIKATLKSGIETKMSQVLELDF